MPKHSKKGDTLTGLSHFDQAQLRAKGGHGSQIARLGTDSQLPFGHCPLSSCPIDDAVVTPSGHMYSREALLEYLLAKTKELKEQGLLYEQQNARKLEEVNRKERDEISRQVSSFVDTQEIGGITKRKASEMETKESYLESRKKLIDDTDAVTKKEQLKKISPWIVDFIPTAADAEIKIPPKRPPSPCTGAPLRSKDLIPIDLIRETSSSSSSSSSSSDTNGTIRFICPVTRKTITTQKIFLIKTTRTPMIESAYNDLAKPSMTCPITGKSFTENDVLELKAAASGFSASGTVVAKIHKPTIN